MRISDWSSDVCSSDRLGRLAPISLDRTAQAGRNIVQPARDPLPHVSQPFRPALDILAQAGPLDDAGVVLTYRRHRLIGPPFPRGHLLGPPLHRRRTRPHMHGGFLLDPLPLVTAMVHPVGDVRQFQRPILHLGPSFPPRPLREPRLLLTRPPQPALRPALPSRPRAGPAAPSPSHSAPYARWVPALSPAAGDCDGPPGRGRSPVPAPDSASRPIVPATARPRRSASGPARASFPPAPQGQGGASSSTGGHGDCAGRPRDQVHGSTRPPPPHAAR